ncbi:hypothetical protein [Chromobacterium sp. ASV23]|uniref:hypothetical protein n=1 Tax=Chromobacterium sp. ASV23 TaxID=2795110 RepID=UPI0018EC635B|nr:hypothetical protein [Chromobacterium sp. ASV23]
METLYRIVTEKISPEVLEGLNSGTMRVSTSRGNVYWAKGSGHTGIVQQLPFEPVNIEDPSNLLQSAQALQKGAVMATAIGTGVILAAIVIQTAYLAKKLNKLQSTVDRISQDIHSQNIIFYMEKITHYFGQVEAARDYLASPDAHEEVRDIAPVILADMATERAQLMLFINNIMELAKNSDHISQEHYTLIIDFVAMAMDLIPKGLFIEKELYVYAEKFVLAEQISTQGIKRYMALIQEYKDWCNNQFRLALKGDKRAALLTERDQTLKALFQSEENRLLLSV